ncbi:MAG: ferredoxin--NADP reductase [Nitrospirae bacterium]|nr:MAG: ferredoxin--NADP reductase [Nitrospirota bacterium]
MATVELNAVVAQRIEVAPGLMVLRVVPDGWPLPEFKPGQFALLGLPGSAPRCALSDPEETPRHPDALIKRAYSIASSSVAHDYLEFFITLVRSGALTPRLFALEPGDRVWLSPKVSGLFTLDAVPAGQDVALISTGTGLAPYMSMLRTHLCESDGRRYAVLHGARHSWDLGYRSELITLARVCGNFTYLPIISRPEEEPVPWTGATGHVQALWEEGALARAWGGPPTPERCHVFLCGNPAMVDDMTERLLAAGWTLHKRRAPGNLHVERYW